MFFTLISKLPLINNTNTKSKSFLILLIGCVLYLIIHAYLYSSHTISNNFIQRWKHYLYLLFSVDLIASGVLRNINTGNEQELIEDVETKKSPFIKKKLEKPKKEEEKPETLEEVVEDTDKVPIYNSKIHSITLP